MKRVVWLAIILGLIVCSGACAACKVTVDPNASVTRTQVEEWSADARLSQRSAHKLVDADA